MSSPGERLAADSDLALGSRVHVRWGLDLLPGFVIDRYDAGSGSRVVVRLESEELREDGPLTITVPESEVYTSEDAALVGPPGSWVPRGIYERQVHHALLVVFSKLEPSIAPTRVEVGRREYDYLVETPDRKLVIEVKFSARGDVTGKMAEQVAAYLKRIPDASAVFVSNGEFTTPAQRTIAHRPIIPVTWRGKEDDSKLEGAIRAALAVRLPANEE